ncbi:hypothetical protein [Streptomyces mobaraensis]|uniref:Uncharacterized protein n=1 Tax=Streptomyces mobaraensis TaxID=35621 RepID=A0A5N5VZC6_STRMB|nr:hypothetical protein [Streptomyces mobaraensis]KAB7833520.1 hypothetical protein FRZ00_33260 [Streptomyces mobaraensis]
MRTTPPRGGPDDTPRAERERDAAWSHLSSADEEDYGFEPVYWPGGKVADVAERLDEVIERAYVSDLKSLSPTDLLAALLVLRTLRDDFTVAEGNLIEAARKKGATWARLAPALEVSSRQAAERRYLRLRGDAFASHPGRTQRERVENERDSRAEHRARRQWVEDHAVEVRALAVRLAAVEDLQERADRSERTFEDGLNRRVFPRPPYTPARWPAALTRAIERDDVHAMFAETRNATLPAVVSLDGHQELVDAITELHRGAAGAGTEVLKARWDRRYGPDPDEDE